jgi:ATP-dependent DNA helicase RecG
MTMMPQKSPAEQLATPAQFLKGVGPQRAELLAKLELHYAVDLLFFFPRAYQDMSELRDIDQLEEKKMASVVGIIDEVDLRNTAPGKSLLGMLLKQGTRYLRCLWFNQPWMREKLVEGRRILVSGEPKQEGMRWEMVHPRIELLADDEDAPAGRILPVYSLTEGINQSQMRRVVSGVVESHAALVEDVFPEDYLDTHQLWPIRAALPQIHQPNDEASLEQAKRRFIYQELLVLQLALAIRKWRLSHQRQANQPVRPIAIPSRQRADRPTGEEIVSAPPPKNFPYPLAVWRVDTVVLIALGMLLVPVGMGRWDAEDIRIRALP